MSTALEIVQGVYASFAKGDIPRVLGALATDVRWTEAEGGPYGGVSIGAQSVLDNVFMKLGSEWEGFTAVPAEFITNDDVVVALGEYSGTFKATGKSFRAPFAHVWRLPEWQGHRIRAVHRYGRAFAADGIGHFIQRGCSKNASKNRQTLSAITEVAGALGGIGSFDCQALHVANNR